MEQRTKNITVQFHERYFATRFVYDPRREPIWREVTAYIENKYIKPGARVADLGAGYCDFINHVRRASERHAVDIFSKLPKYAAEGVTPHVQSVTELSCFGDRSLDVIFASNLFEHLTHAELLETLEEIRRVLAIGGRMIVMQPNFKLCYKTYFDDYTHLQIFTDQGMYDLFEMAGLEVVDVQARFMPVNMKSTLKLKLPFLDLIVRMYLKLPFRPLAGQMLVVAENNYEPEQEA